MTTQKEKDSHKTWKKRYLKVSATIKAEPIQYRPNANQPNPKNHPAIKVCFNEERRVIR